MIKFYTKIIDLEISQEEIISRLTWKIHQVKNPLFARSNSWYANTNKPLIGEIDELNNWFNVTRLRPFLLIYIPKLLVEGKIIDLGKKSKLTLEFRPGLLTTILLTLLIYNIIKMIFIMIISNDLQILFTSYGIKTLIVIPIIVVSLVSWEMKKTTQKILKIIGLNETQ